MDTKKLRQKILDLAIRGKLVPQDPNDEPASVLLERIRAEKEQLIKEGKIKRSKKSASTDKSHYENPPFEIPESWEWVTLNDVCCVARGGSPRPIKKYLITDENGINWIKIGDTDKEGKYINSTKEKITTEGARRSRYVSKGDLLLTNSMSFGHPYILNINGCIHDGWLVISPISETYSTDFLYYLLSSTFAYEQFAEVASGGVVSNLNSYKVAVSNFPLPPLAEQGRIVNEIEHWFTLLNHIEQDKIDLQTTMKKIKSEILNLAIIGKLEPQDSNDEPAIELLKRINPNFVPCDNSHYENLPFEVPNNWCWATLGSIGKWQSGATPSRMRKDYYGGEIPWLKTGDLNDGLINNIPEYITQKALDETSVKLNPAGSILIAMYGATIGKIGILTMPATTNQACCACVSHNGVEQMYLFYFLLSHREEFIRQGGGGAQPNISKEKIIETMIPVPPLNEQHRIVQAIDTIFNTLNTITAEL